METSSILSYLLGFYFATGIIGGIIAIRTMRTFRRYIRRISNDLDGLREIASQQLLLHQQMARHIDAISLRSQMERNRRIKEVMDTFAQAMNKAAQPRK